MADSTICVAVRSRPILMTEAHCSKANIQYFGAEPHISLNNKIFAFDYVFPPNLTNSDIYKQAISDRIQRVFQGYNLTILAYGQTGSGKTFTMGTNYSSGQTYEDYELGLIPRGVEDIFAGIQRKSEEASFVVKVSFLEVYREEVFDLLSGNKPTSLSIREDCFGPKVANLTAVTVNSAQEALQALERGANRRKTAATAMNAKSSRSHALFSVYIEQKDLVSHCTIYSKFQLVDLAGSERVGSSKTEGVRFREGVNINMGLLALGNVINALWERSSHIPYRDSKLTRLLMDSLGGNSLTLMIACINPVEAVESLKTLYYADRAQKVKNKPKLNIDPPEVQVSKLKEQVQILQSQLYQMQTYGNEDGLSNNNIKQENLRNELMSSAATITELTQKLIEAEEKVEKFEKFRVKVELLCAKIGWIISKLNTDEESGLELSNVLEQVKEIEYLSTELTDEYLHGKTCSTQLQISPVSEDLEIPEMLEGETDSNSDQSIEDLSSDTISLKQAEIGREIVEIERCLSRKAQEMEHFETICSSFAVPGIQQEDVNVMMNKIKVLEQEREELAEALKISEKNLIEERQKRYNQCQTEIKALEAEVHKSRFMLKLKDQHQKKVEALQKEILSLKQTRINLVKKMRQECNSFRQMQRAKDKEVAQLKQKDRKKEIEFSKKTNQLEKQISVLKTRIDRANAVKERFKQAFQTNEPRFSGNKGKKIEPKKITEWIEHENDMAVYRKLMDDQYNNAKENAETLEEQFRSIQETAEKLPGLEGKEYLKTVLELHKKRLFELKDTTFHVAEKGESNRWDRINTVAEAKHGLDALFQKCVSARVEVAKQADQLLEIQASMNQMYEEKVEALNTDRKSLKEKLEAMENQYEDKLCKQRCEYEKKTLELLKQMNCFESACMENETSNCLQEKLQFQAEEIAKFSAVYEDYQKKCEEAEMLKEKLLKAKKGKKIKWLSDITLSKCNMTGAEGKENSALLEYLNDEDAEESILSSKEENDENDPDWRATPVFRRRKRPMRVLDSAQNILDASSESGDSIIPLKRSFSGCECPGDCKTKRCGCQKKSMPCSVSCACLKDRCVNQIAKEA